MGNSGSVSYNSMAVANVTEWSAVIGVRTTDNTPARIGVGWEEQAQGDMYWTAKVQCYLESDIPQMFSAIIGVPGLYNLSLYFGDSGSSYLSGYAILESVSPVVNYNDVATMELTFIGDGQCSLL